MSRIFIFLFPFLICGVLSCTSGSKKTSYSISKGRNLPISYAKGFTISDHGKYRVVTVKDPWQQSAGINFEYYLVDREKEIPAELKEKQVIRTPVRSVICLSTSHIGFLSAIGETESLKALSGAGFVSDSTVQKAVASKRVFDVGYDQGINYELILSLKPDLIMAYGVGGEVTGFIGKLRDLGLNVILNGEYLEESPLAKAEWIKFVGEFYNKDQVAADYFSRIEKNYNEIKQKVANVKTHPVVLTGLPYKDAWWIAGGHSNLAALINDAGGEFLWRDNISREAFVVSLEEVVVRSARADFWINCGTVNNLAELIATDSRFAAFPQVQKRAIFNNNLQVSPGGGNDYWERGVVRPDLILSDLVKIFHPECDNGKVYNFYKRIE
jgi:iron complex transport system substrate-binding protein